MPTIDFDSLFDVISVNDVCEDGSDLPNHAFITIVYRVLDWCLNVDVEEIWPDEPSWWQYEKEGLGEDEFFFNCFPDLTPRWKDRDLENFLCSGLMPGDLVRVRMYRPTYHQSYDGEWDADYSTELVSIEHRIKSHKARSLYALQVIRDISEYNRLRALEKKAMAKFVKRHRQFWRWVSSTHGEYHQSRRASLIFLWPKYTLKPGETRSEQTLLYGKEVENEGLFPNCNAYGALLEKACAELGMTPEEFRKIPYHKTHCW